MVVSLYFLITRPKKNVRWRKNAKSRFFIHFDTQEFSYRKIHHHINCVTLWNVYHLMGFTFWTLLYFLWHEHRQCQFSIFENPMVARAQITPDAQATKNRYFHYWKSFCCKDTSFQFIFKRFVNLLLLIESDRQFWRKKISQRERQLREEEQVLLEIESTTPCN